MMEIDFNMVRLIGTLESYSLTVKPVRITPKSTQIVRRVSLSNSIPIGRLEIIRIRTSDLMVAPSMPPLFYRQMLASM